MDIETEHWYMQQIYILPIQTTEFIQTIKKFHDTL
jgi:hypothetical protein